MKSYTAVGGSNLATLLAVAGTQTPYVMTLQDGRSLPVLVSQARLGRLKRPSVQHWGGFAELDPKADPSLHAEFGNKRIGIGWIFKRGPGMVPEFQHQLADGDFVQAMIMLF